MANKYSFKTMWIDEKEMFSATLLCNGEVCETHTFKGHNEMMCWISDTMAGMQLCGDDWEMSCNEKTFAAKEDAGVEKVLCKQIRTEVMRTFCNWLTASDIYSLAESIIDECVEDVKVCSDYPHYNDSDVRLAIQRVVIGRVIGE